MIKGSPCAGCNKALLKKRSILSRSLRGKLGESLFWAKSLLTEKQAGLYYFFILYIEIEQTDG